MNFGKIVRIQAENTLYPYIDSEISAIEYMNDDYVDHDYLADEIGKKLYVWIESYGYM